MLEIYVHDVGGKLVKLTGIMDYQDAWITVFGSYPATLHATAECAADFIAEIANEGVDIDRATVYKVRLTPLVQQVKTQMDRGYFMEVKDGNEPVGTAEK